MKFSYNWLQSYFSKKLPEPNKLAELLTMHSFEVEDVEKKGGDWLLDIDILPNRAHDCLSHYGVARECAALLNYKLQITNYKQAPNSKSQTKKLLNVEIKDKALCPRYTAYMIDNVKIKDSPKWIKDRLAVVGQKPINNVVDLTNYIMWDLGQPLHAFDFDKIEGGKMTIRRSKKGEKLETLDGVTYDLGESDIIIEDENRLIDLAGIKGGGNTQVERDTKKVILQAAIFDPAHIRRTTKAFGVRTEAAVRYMHGFDLSLPIQAVDYAFSLLQETNPEAKIVQKIDIYPKPAKPRKIGLYINYVNKLLGTYLSIREIRQILERLGFGVEGGKLQVAIHKLQVTVPTYRLDIKIAEDLIEEIARLYGYENIQPDAPRGLLATPRRNDDIFWRSMTRNILAGFGFSEVYNYSFISREQASDYKFELLEPENPISEELQYLRPWLLHGALKNVATNEKYFESVKLFEIGKVFFAEGREIIEEENLIFTLSGKGIGARGFYELKGYADEFLKKLGVSDFYFDPNFSEDDELYHGLLLHPSRRANIRVDNFFAGFIGEVHPRLLKKFDIKTKVYCLEFNFGKISTAAEEEHIYQKPSKYPEVVRDIALLVPRDVMVVNVLNIINSISGPTLRDIDLFDMYESENLPEGMKNFAFHLIFQSDKRTLTAKEVEDVLTKITKALEDKGWEVR